MLLAEREVDEFLRIKGEDIFKEVFSSATEEQLKEHCDNLVAGKPSKLVTSAQLKIISYIDNEFDREFKETYCAYEKENLKETEKKVRERYLSYLTSSLA